MPSARMACMNAPLNIVLTHWKPGSPLPMRGPGMMSILGLCCSSSVNIQRSSPYMSSPMPLTRIPQLKSGRNSRNIAAGNTSCVRYSSAASPQDSS